MNKKISINFDSEYTRLTDIGKLIQEINIRLCHLYKRDYIYVDSPALYKKLVRLNDLLLSKIAKKTGTVQTHSFGLIEHLPEANNNKVDSDFGVDLDLLQDIEIKLCEVCDRYEAMLDNNPYANPSFKDYFMPIKIEVVGFIKAARRTIYSFC